MQTSSPQGFRTAEQLRAQFFFERDRRQEAEAHAAPRITPSTSADRTRNPLRPHSLRDVIGQERAKSLMQRAVLGSRRRRQPLDHTLLIGPAGTGKSTFSHAIANELGVDVYELEAPISTDTLLELSETMRDGDILKIEEIHQQAIMERRGRSAATQPEVLYAVMEDRTLPTATGVLPFPAITLIGTTTDEGMLPDAFLSRFALQPRLDPYSMLELMEIARFNARVLRLAINDDGARIFARASRGVPRQINNFMKNAAILAMRVDKQVAMEVLAVNGTTHDGLNHDMQGMLTFLYRRAKQTTASGEVRYQASVNTIATALGKSRDTKAIALRVEPWLIERGFVQVTPSGRRLTDDGILRAQELLVESRA